MNNEDSKTGRQEASATLRSQGARNEDKPGPGECDSSRSQPGARKFASGMMLRRFATPWVQALMPSARACWICGASRQYCFEDPVRRILGAGRWPVRGSLRREGIMTWAPGTRGWR